MAIEQLYLIHHSHTDIGYTHDQPIVWELERRFIDAALELCAQGDDAADDAFRWTVETTAPLWHWLEHATPEQTDRLLRAERAGRLEVMGMPLNLTPLVDSDQLLESLQPLAVLRQRWGLTVRHAMNCDVNGHNWPFVDVLLDAGIEAFSMAINEHFGGAPLERPNVFAWEGPSGRRLLTFNGWHYMQGNFLGIPHDPQRFQTMWAEIEERLETRGWPLPGIAVQITHPSGDNGSADPRLPEFVRAWNASGQRPHIRLAVPREWWAAVRAAGPDVPSVRGDWTDYWNFGAISSARETAMNRRSRIRLRAADAVATVGSSAAAADRLRLRAEAWRALTLWDEHTWGADISVRDPESEDTLAQWHHKAITAYQARSLSLLLQRDALAELVQRIPHGDDDAVVLINPSASTRTLGGPVPQTVLSRRGLPGDASATRHFVDREPAAPTRWLPPVEVAGLGWRVIPGADLREWHRAPQTSAATIENGRFRITFDRERGGIASWWDKTLGRDWVDTTAPWPLGGFVHEEVADHAHNWPRQLLYRYPDGWPGDWHARRQGARVRRHQVWRLSNGWEVAQHLDAPGVDEAVLTFTLPDDADLEVRASWRMRPVSHPEATYLVFPFALSEATARFDAGATAVRLDADQLPGCSRDYFTTQLWVELSGRQGSVTIATPENPLAQVGGFGFGRAARQVDLGRAWFLGWVTNNYWETNFRAHQAGRVEARYVLRPRAGAFEEESAHRFGEAVAQGPLWAPAWDPTRPGADLPRSGQLLQVAGEAIRLLRLWPDADGGALVRLANSSDQETVAHLGGGVRAIAAATDCDIFGVGRGDLPVVNGTCALRLAPRRIQTVRLRWA